MDRLRTLPGLLSCALWLAGCAHSPEPQPEQSGSTLPVASATGLPSSVPFVSPASYEGFIRGELYAARGDDGRAISAYRAAIELGESDPFLVAQLAAALERTDQTVAAEGLLEASLGKQPRSEALLLASARIARRSGHEARALAAYARAQEAASAPTAALERIGYLRELGGEERSVEALRALANQQGGLHKGGVRDRLRIELELALAERAGRDVARCARDWLALGGGDPLLTRRAAEALLAHGHAALALELLAAVAPNELDTPLRLRAALALGRSAECEQLLSSMPPHWLGGPLAMGEAYLQAGRPDQALRVLQESDSTQDDRATAARRAELIARALSASGRAHEAAALLDRTDARAATCEALQASALSALARDAGCTQ